MQEGSNNAMSPETLPKAIFRFLDLSEINLALREEEVKLYIIMFSNQSPPFIVSVTYWPRLGELEPMYRIKTMTATHQCITPTTRTPRTFGRVTNDYLNPNTSSMKIVAQAVIDTLLYSHSQKVDPIGYSVGMATGRV